MANPTTPFRNREEPRSPGMSSGTEKARETAASMTEKAKDMASSATHSAGETASNVAQKVRDTASSVGQSASDMASNAGHRAEETTSTVGGGMRSLAGQLRETMPHEGMLGSASSAVADTLDRGGRYLQEEGLQGIASDLTHLIRRHPVPALLIALGVGFLVARSLRS
jgi:vacuolar-type H+-ATPase subunit H